MPNAILDPTGRTTTTKNAAALAPRRADLRGATVGLLENTKHNAHPPSWTAASSKRHGTPIAVICSDAFRGSADAIANLRGMPGRPTCRTG